MNKDVNSFVKLLRRNGVTVKRNRKYLSIVCPHGDVWLSTTPSDWRWRLNTIAAMRAQGLDIDDFRRERRARKLIGGAPPPVLGDVIEHSTQAKEEVSDMASGRGRNSTRYTHRDYERGKKMFNEMGELLGLQVRKGNTMPHGTVQVVEKILLDYTAERGIDLPEPRPGAREKMSRERQAYLLAMRVQDLVTHRQQSSWPSTREAFELALEGWEWEKERMTSPEPEPEPEPEIESEVEIEDATIDGVGVVYQGIVGAEDEQMAREALIEMGVMEPLPEMRVAPKPSNGYYPLHMRVLAELSIRGSVWALDLAEEIRLLEEKVK